MTTIYDVAKTARVSPKTVSRVLNENGTVGDETRARVEKAIGALGYVPSSAARMLRSNKSGFIGLITGAISGRDDRAGPDGLPDLCIVQGVQQEMARHGRTLMIADTGGDPERAVGLARTFHEHRVEGLIYVADYHREVDFGALQSGCPCILVNCFDDRATPCILPDERMCQERLVAQLVAVGHRQIAYLTLESGMTATKPRVAGYRAALEAAGIAFDETLVITGYQAGSQDRMRDLEHAFAQLLTRAGQRGGLPDAIVCGNDKMALRLYDIMRRRGLNVPEDISVAGFDDYRAIAETLSPSLTTVELPYVQMGRRAALELLAATGTPGPASDDPGDAGGPILVAGSVKWRSSVTAHTPSN